jgi:hypothetical protein
VEKLLRTVSLPGEGRHDVSEAPYGGIIRFRWEGMISAFGTPASYVAKVSINPELPKFFLAFAVIIG